MKEIWKDISGYEGTYQVSSEGKVRSLRSLVKSKNDSLRVRSGKERSFSKVNGYNMCILFANNVRKVGLVHRLVAEAFIPNTENKPCINHKNGDRGDNRVENLEWCTYSENSLHSYSVLGRKNVPVNPQRVKSIRLSDGAEIEHESINSAAKTLSLHFRDIKSVLSGRTKKTHGFTFQKL